MIGIWYNPHKDSYYSKYIRTSYFFDYYHVGYINKFDHVLVALFKIEDKKLISCQSLSDYYSHKRGKNQSKKNKRLKNLIVNWLIKQLERSVKNE